MHVTSYGVAKLSFMKKLIKKTFMTKQNHTLISHLGVKQKFTATISYQKVLFWCIYVIYVCISIVAQMQCIQYLQIEVLMNERIINRVK